MSAGPHLKLFNAVNATTTSPLVARADLGDYDVGFSKTNTGTGDLALQTNDVSDQEFAIDPTAGWIQHDMAAATGIVAGKIDVPATNPWTAKVKLTRFRPRRHRWVFTKTGGTTALSGDVTWE